jgi:hypothetical protein
MEQLADQAHRATAQFIAETGAAARTTAEGTTFPTTGRAGVTVLPLDTEPAAKIAAGAPARPTDRPPRHATALADAATGTIAGAATLTKPMEVPHLEQAPRLAAQALR